MVTQAGPYARALTLRFGRGGNSAPYQIFGWSDPEDGYTFTTGLVSLLQFETAEFKDGCLIELLLQPFAKEPALPSQSINIRVNGVTVGSCRLTTRTRICVDVPSTISFSGISTIAFEHQDAKSPQCLGVAADNRILGFSFFELSIFPLQGPPRPRVCNKPFANVRLHADQLPDLADETREHGIDVRDLMLGFESIGDNCEFGLFQRALGAEPLGLLRFSTVHLMPLVEGIEFDFDGLGEERNMLPKPEDDGNEWMMYETRYNLRYHTYVRPDKMSEANVRRREMKKLAFLRQKFLEDLREANKVFVYKNAIRSPSTEEVLPIYRALNMHAHNILLWVIPAEHGYLPGTVEEVLPGLLRGHIDRLANVHTPGHHSLKGWLEVCLAVRSMMSRDP